MSDEIKRIAEALSFEEIRALGRQALGIEMERGEGINERIIEQEPPKAQQPTTEVPLSASGYKYEEEIRWHDRLHRRPVIIRANTPERLAELKRIVLGE